METIYGHPQIATGSFCRGPFVSDHLDHLWTPTNRRKLEINLFATKI